LPTQTALALTQVSGLAGVSTVPGAVSPAPAAAPQPTAEPTLLPLDIAYVAIGYIERREDHVAGLPPEQVPSDQVSPPVQLPDGS
jgi:hypothetical protein